MLCILACRATSLIFCDSLLIIVRITPFTCRVPVRIRKLFGKLFLVVATVMLIRVTLRLAIIFLLTVLMSGMNNLKVNRVSRILMLKCVRCLDPLFDA